MKKRTITGIAIGIVYIATLLLSIYWHKAVFDIFVLFLALVAGMEMSRAFSQKFGKAMDVFIILTAVGGYFAFHLVHNYFGTGTGGITAYFGVLAIMFLLCIVFTMISKTKTIRNAVSTMLVLIYPVSILIYMLGINYLPDSLRINGLISIFIISCFTDTFAYLVGSTVRGPKLCPKISPKKTISGAVGGLFGGIFASVLVMVFGMFGILGAGALSQNTFFNVMHFIIIGIVGAVFTQLGDLIASYLKRSCGVKDFGKLLPGHGGVLDRVDGMMFASVFVFIYLTVLSFV